MISAIKETVWRDSERVTVDPLSIGCSAYSLSEEVIFKQRYKG